MRQPINPYIAGPPLWDAQDFFGRQDTLKWVVGQLHKPTTNALLLFGQRRIGKTSFLFQLEISPRERSAVALRAAIWQPTLSSVFL